MVNSVNDNNNLCFLFFDDNAQEKKQKGQGSKKKDTDISTVRLRAATKLLNQRKLLGSMLQDSDEKCKVGLWPYLMTQ